MDRLRFDSLFVVGISPFDGSGCFVVLPNITHEFGVQVGERVEHATTDDMALDFREPVFDLVERRRQK